MGKVVYFLQWSNCTETLCECFYCKYFVFCDRSVAPESNSKLWLRDFEIYKKFGGELKEFVTAEVVLSFLRARFDLFREQFYLEPRRLQDCCYKVIFEANI